ncbi:MAG: D-aminoacylase [Dehalococcoidia bacterium]|nr:D-aminoacylase [Dehalococcoidia bacterium]
MSDASETTTTFDLIIRGGTVYDGSGGEPYVADVAVRGDRIASIGSLGEAQAGTVIDASGLAVAPGFINMLSHSYHSMLHDRRSLSELTQGVTTQVFGEGNSQGPLTPEMRRRMQGAASDRNFDVEWSTLAEYLAFSEKRGVSQNVASFVGATTLRIHAVGHENRPATELELELMRSLVRDEMAAGALGIGSSLIYPPAFFASTEELIELCKAAAPFRGKYISHMRNEGNELLEAIDELVRIGREAGVPAEIYHLKAAGRSNWGKLDQAIEMIEDARARGGRISADMYTYTAGSTGLSNAIPPWFHEGGPRKLLDRLEDPDVRKEIRRAIEETDDGWENMYRASGGAEGVLVLGVRKEENRRYQGKTLARVAEMMGTDHIDALMDLVLRDRSRIDTAYFMISEENLREQLRLPWVSFGSDARSMAAEADFLQASTHPRAYGNFARLLGAYVRDERILPLPEAVRRLTRLPAGNLELDRRGRIEEGYFADIVVFDPETIADRATYEDPHQYSVGVRDVIVNGTPVLRDGAHTAEFPGRALYGPGKRC